MNELSVFFLHVNRNACRDARVALNNGSACHVMSRLKQSNLILIICVSERYRFRILLWLGTTELLGTRVLRTKPYCYSPVASWHAGLKFNKNRLLLYLLWMREKLHVSCSFSFISQCFMPHNNRYKKFVYYFSDISLGKIYRWVDSFTTANFRFSLVLSFVKVKV